MTDEVVKGSEAAARPSRKLRSKEVEKRWNGSVLPERRHMELRLEKDVCDTSCPWKERTQPQSQQAEKQKANATAKGGRERLGHETGVDATTTG